MTAGQPSTEPLTERNSRHPVPELGTEREVLLRRVIAYLIDGFGMIVLPILVAAGGLAFLSITGIESQLHVDPSGGTLDVDGTITTVWGLVPIALAFVTPIVYMFFLEGLFGQTPGKRLTGIVVVKTDGTPCTITASIVRRLFWIVSHLGLLFLVDLLLLYLTDRTQRIGDLLAGTVVVRTA